MLKRSDVIKHLAEEEWDQLGKLLDKVERGRMSEGKKLNAYLICNTDEPYSSAVLAVILEGEELKEMEAINNGHTKQE